LYYPDPAGKAPGKLPSNVNNAITGVALCGTLTGQLFFGWLGDRLGRKKVYGITLVTMVGCAIASGLSLGSTPQSVVATLCFFRFWLGFGIGGDYPLSAVIMSEYANQRTRGGFIAAVFAMQGFGILVAGLVAMTISKLFLIKYDAPSFQQSPTLSAQRQGDFVWRIVLMLGAVPAAATYYWRMKMPETARFTALVEGNHAKAAADMRKVLDADIAAGEGGQVESSSSSSSPSWNRQNQPYGLFSKEFAARHGKHLLGTTTTWFLLDVAFYTMNLTQKDVYSAAGILPKASRMNAIQELGGFLLMSIFMAIVGGLYTKLRGNQCTTSKTGFCGGHPGEFAALYGLTFFFANFGPNSTTFIVPAELFPARFRSTCHGISAAAGKAGAVVGAFWIQNYTVGGDGRKVRDVLIALAAVNFLGFLFTFLVPETRGRSLEEISGDDQIYAANGTNNGEEEETKKAAAAAASVDYSNSVVETIV
ncbi:putative inorganic phosphate transporter 1-3, partial [Ananas comosus]